MHVKPISATFFNWLSYAALLLLMVPVAYAAVPAAVFGELYQPVPNVSQFQSQIVYYRPVSSGQNESVAHVYVDNQFHTALLPGAFTAFCIGAGAHSMGSVFNDAPAYAGKKSLQNMDLAAGETRFIRVDESGERKNVPVDRMQAERELAGSQNQVHMKSRVTSLRTCEYLPAVPREPVSFSFTSDVMFPFGKAGYEDMSDEGRRTIADVTQRLLEDSRLQGQIKVVGHTDRIGQPSDNDALGLRRAQTVARVLRESGINGTRIRVNSAGGRVPATQGCAGDRTELISCYAPDRRVVISIDGHGNND